MEEDPLLGQDALLDTIRGSFDSLPHLFITGPPGSGKTSFLRHAVRLFQTEAPFRVEQVLWLSSEKDRGIHTIRDKVTDFCKRSTIAPNSLRFIVIDDADSLPLISQQALRRPMETYAHLTRFLFASRHPSHLIEPLRSRCLSLELEPINPMDAYPSFLDQYGISIPSEESTSLLDFCVRHFITLREMRSILRVYKASRAKGESHLDGIRYLSVLLPTNKIHTNSLISGLAKADISLCRKAITELTLSGYLLDDILLSVEKSTALFPASVPEERCRILQFIANGWISIQQGKEHWLDTMDILGSLRTEV